MRGSRQAAASNPSPAGKPIPGGRFLFRLILLALLLPLSSRAGNATPPPDTATVVEVVDGDTLRVRTRDGGIATIRMIGIDAPERGHPSRPKEFVADEAADALAALCMGKQVRLAKGREDTDKYGRFLRYVSSGDGRLLLNRELLRKGMARVYRRFPFSRQPEFEAAEAEARKEGLGIWRDGGLDELRWARLKGGEPVSVWPLGGGEYVIVHGGMGKSGIEPEKLQPEIATLARLRAELSDAEFGPGARRAGFRPVGAEGAPMAAPPARPGTAKDDPRPAQSSGHPLAGTVSWEHAHEHPGETVTVEGTVVRAKRNRGTVFLNFHPNWKRYLTVVLFTGKLPGLPESPETFFLDRKVRVVGTVKLYKGRPEIVVERADDIRIVP